MAQEYTSHKCTDENRAEFIIFSISFIAVTLLWYEDWSTHALFHQYYASKGYADTPIIEALPKIYLRMDIETL